MECRMKLKELLVNIPDHHLEGSREISITGICSNSKLVAPGNLFIAKKGTTDHGAHYIAEAIELGACAILTDLLDPSLKQVVQIIHPDVTKIEAILAAKYYQEPSNELLMIGITGTNGKTTTSFILQYLLNHFFGLCGLIGTIEYLIGSRRYQATRTTPDVISNHRMLREMISQECRAGIMEVTSHALNQGRVEMIDYDIAIFSNLTLDHLDYHQTMENYCAAKNRLFRNLGQQASQKKYPKLAIANADSPWTNQILEGCQCPIISYGIENSASLRAINIEMDQKETKLLLAYQEKLIPCRWPLIGYFNIYNCLSAIAVMLALGHELEEIAEKMKTLPAIRGRLEPVPNSLGLTIYVDFAHSDDSLKNVLKTLKELTRGRLINVFGCGGDRDQSKRVKMAQVSELYADFTIVTSDNPRSEDPQVICEAVAKGFESRISYCIEVDRRLAIQKAIEMANPDDVILIAGKGHETYQIFAHQTLAFDDCEVAANICLSLNQKD